MNRAEMSHNVAHVARRRVKPEEVGEVHSNNPVFIETETDEVNGEERISRFDDADSKTRALYAEAQFRKDDE